MQACHASSFPLWLLTDAIVATGSVCLLPFYLDLLGGLVNYDDESVIRTDRFFWRGSCVGDGYWPSWGLEMLRWTLEEDRI